MITQNSRYVKAAVTVVEDRHGKHQSVTVPEPQASTFNFTYYQTEYDDTPYWIAHVILGDGRLWWMVADANPEILDWSFLEPGTIIRIPNAS